jgi:hypothetical protein
MYFNCKNLPLSQRYDVPSFHMGFLIVPRSITDVEQITKARVHWFKFIYYVIRMGELVANNSMHVDAWIKHSRLQDYTTDLRFRSRHESHSHLPLC